MPAVASYEFFTAHLFNIPLNYIELKTMFTDGIRHIGALNEDDSRGLWRFPRKVASLCCRQKVSGTGLQYKYFNTSFLLEFNSNDGMPRPLGVAFALA